MNQIFKNTDKCENYWQSISDMMTGLMMIFLFISISYMITVSHEKNKIKEIAITYNTLQTELYKDLYEEFKDDLEKWSAYIDKKTLSIRFEAPDILFKTGSCMLKNNFKSILSNFFPRYMLILTNSKYKNEIEEIRIEGHTSSEWNNIAKSDKAYFKNMELSQDRTRSVLEYTMKLNDIQKHRDWLKNHLTANGLSSSKLLLQKGIEDKEKSRRVEFRVKTNAEKRISKILQEG